MGAKQDNFIEQVGAIAQAEYLSREKWVLPSVCIAQAALESGWNLKAKTLFGIKAKAGDASFSSVTSEFYSGRYVQIVDAFKSYPNIASAIGGYMDLITSLKRYKGAVNNPDYRSAITAIKAGGYATDPDYVLKIVAIIEMYGLTRFDTRTPDKKAKSVEDLAREVIAGKWGNGQERKDRLTAAGYSPTEVQRKVNQLLK